MSLDDIKKLRGITALGINDCKKALAESGGDFRQALDILKNRGAQVLQKKSTRSANQGLVDSYIHFGGNLGVLVEVNCETDFVAKTEIFKNFVKDIAMQIAAANPSYINRDDVPAEILEKNVNPDEYCRQNCLIEQQFIKDNSLTIGQYLERVVSQSGERVVIRRFSRYALGEDDESQL